MQNFKPKSGQLVRVYSRRYVENDKGLKTAHEHPASPFRFYRHNYKSLNATQEKKYYSCKKDGDIFNFDTKEYFITRA